MGCGENWETAKLRLTISNRVLISKWRIGGKVMALRSAGGSGRPLMVFYAIDLDSRNF